jgi:hypothetical protein
MPNGVTYLIWSAQACLRLPYAKLASRQQSGSKLPHSIAVVRCSKFAGGSGHV